MKARIRSMVLTAGVAAAAVGVTAGPASAQAATIDCSAIDPALGGVIVFTPSGNLNGNCFLHEHPEGPGGPAGGDGATVIPCEEFEEFGPGFQGNVVISPSGNVNVNCRLHVH